MIPTTASEIINRAHLIISAEPPIYSNWILEGPKNNPATPLAVAAADIDDIGCAVYQLAVVSDKIDALAVRRKILGYEVPVAATQAQVGLDRLWDHNPEFYPAFVAARAARANMPLMLIAFTLDANDELIAILYHPIDVPTSFAIDTFKDLIAGTIALHN